jgi:ribulose-phosphate 3-epimerase
MSVNPGFGGQKFITAATDKVARLKALRTAHNAHFLIEVDGGVNLKTGAQLAAAGADALVAGSFVFSAADPVATIAELKSL